MARLKRKTLALKGRHTVLPIIGDIVVGFCASVHRPPEIIFADSDGHESVLELSDRFGIGKGTVTDFVQHDRPVALAPLLELVGVSVADAVAFADGRLELSFSNAFKLEAASTTGLEAWRFQFPRPGRPAGGDVSNHVSVRGAHGRLE